MKDIKDFSDKELQAELERRYQTSLVEVKKKEAIVAATTKKIDDTVKKAFEELTALKKEVYDNGGYFGWQFDALVNDLERFANSDGAWLTSSWEC